MFLVKLKLGMISRIPLARRRKCENKWWVCGRMNSNENQLTKLTENRKMARIYLTKLTGMWLNLTN
jgi:hypothetical protein